MAEQVIHGKYVSVDNTGRRFRHARGWTNYYITRDLVYSHRDTFDLKADFEEVYHAHKAFEIVLFVGENVDYVCNHKLITPPPFSAVWSCPGEFHNTRLLCDSRYERYVFRFTADTFSLEGEQFALPRFLTGQGRFVPLAAHRADVLALLAELDSEISNAVPNRLRALTLFWDFMGMLSCAATETAAPATDLPQGILQVKKYIDENYTAIRSVQEIAEHFFYSREHVSRLFRQYFNMSVAAYLTRYRITKSLALLETGSSVSEACFAVGFCSLSAFSDSFKKIVGCTPSTFHHVKHAR